MNLLMVSSLVTSHGSVATVDDVNMGLRVLDENFRDSLILGGALVALLAVLVLVLYTCLLVTELQKVTR